nr:S8 family serine peptidase [Gammaproteobacteria bacterium]
MFDFKASTVVSLLVACVLGIAVSVNPVSAESVAPSAKMEERARAKINHDLRRAGHARVIVRLKSERRGMSRSGRAQALSSRQDRVKRRLGWRAQRNMKRMRNTPVIALEANSADLQALLDSGDVEAVVEDRLLSPTLNLSTPHIGAGAVHSTGLTGQGQTVVIFDTGIDRTHPNFGSRVVAEACFSSNSGSSSSLCPNGQTSQFGTGAAAPCASGCNHGTHVAGIAAGSSATYTGVAPGASIIGVQVFSNTSSGLLAWWSDILRALDWVYDQRNNYNIAAVNMSLGGDKSTTAISCDASSPSMKSSIDQLRSVGIATVVAAGNQGYSDGLNFPGCISSAITVGSTTIPDAMSGFSNAASWMDFVAPGSGIASSIPGGGYQSWNGTSMATPQVAGAFALLKSGFPNATVDELAAAMQVTSTLVADAGNGLSFERVNVDLAAAELASGVAVNIILDDDYDGFVAAGQFSSVVTATQAYGGRGRRSSGSGLDRYRFEPGVPVNGTYRVYAWWPASNANSTATRFSISHTGGVSNVAKNQRVDGAKWNVLGDYQLNGSSYLEVSDPSGGAMVDAVRFELLPSGPPPTTPPVIGTTSVPSGTVGQSYSVGVAVTDGTSPYTWSISSGALPSGLSLANGVISGTPSSSGVWNFTVRVVDANGEQDTQSLTITVSTAPPSITTTSLAAGAVGQPYTKTLTAVNGTAPLTWSLFSGSLPNGVQLSNGVISGTPDR